MKNSNASFPRKTLQSSGHHNYSGTKELENGEVLVNYNADIVKKLSRSLDFFPEETAPRVLDFGAGIGTIAKVWRDETGIEPELCEIDPFQRARLKEMGFKKVSSAIGEKKPNYDIVYSSNVIEHIENDLGTLEEIFRSIKTGGILALYVPAMPILFSDLDKRVGHYRRYTRSGLTSVVRNAGFKVLGVEFSDSLGVPASLAIKILGWDTDRGLGGARALNLYDSILYPISKFFDLAGLRFIMGKNLFLLARKPLNHEVGLGVMGNDKTPGVQILNKPSSIEGP